MALSLGDLTFGVGAETKGIERAINRIVQFSREVDKAAASQEAAEHRRARAMSQSETAMVRSLNTLREFRRTVSLIQGEQGGIGPTAQFKTEQVREASLAYRDLQSVLTRTGVGFEEVARAQALFDARMKNLNRNVRNFNLDGATGQTGKFGRAIRNLESASVLAVGPLSGLGARIRALGSIVSRTDLLMAGMFATVAGGLVVIAKLAAGAVRASITFAKLQSALEVGTGGIEAAGEAIDFVVETSRRFKVSVASIAPEFGKLAAAAAGTVIQGEAVRNVFTGLVAAGRALNLQSTEVAGAFRAIQQVISKGKAQAEELRGQFGERIPGGFRLAATAIGKTTAEFSKMLENGEVLAEDLIPKLGLALIEAFGTQAEKQAHTLAAAIDDLGNSTLLFNRELDNTLSISRNWERIISGLTSTIDFMTQHIQTLTAVTIAFVSSMLLMFSPAIFAGFAALIGWLARATAGVRALNLAVLLFPGVGLVAILARVGLALAGGAAGWFAFSAAMEETEEGFVSLNDRIDSFLEKQKAVGRINEEQTKGFVKEVQKRIQAKQIELAAFSKIAQDEETLNDRLKRVFGIGVSLPPPLPGKRAPGSRPGMPGGVAHLESTEERATRGFDEAADELEKYSQQLERLLNPTLDATEKTAAFSDELNDLVDDIKEMAMEFDQQVAMFETLANEGLEAGKSLEFLHEAQTALAEIDPKEYGEITRVLKTMGFEGRTTADALAQLMGGLARLEAQVEETTANLEEQPEVLAEMALEFERLQAATAAMNRGPKAFEAFEEAEERTDKIQDLRESLEEVGFSQEMVNAKVAEYILLLEKFEAAEAKMERQIEIAKEIEKAFDRAFDRIGDAITEAFVRGEDALVTFNNLIHAILGEILQSIVEFTILNPLQTWMEEILGGLMGGTGTGGEPTKLFGGVLGELFSGGGEKPEEKSAKELSEMAVAAEKAAGGLAAAAASSESASGVMGKDLIGSLVEVIGVEGVEVATTQTLVGALVQLTAACEAAALCLLNMCGGGAGAPATAFGSSAAAGEGAFGLQGGGPIAAQGAGAAGPTGSPAAAGLSAGSIALIVAATIPVAIGLYKTIDTFGAGLFEPFTKPFTAIGSLFGFAEGGKTPGGRTIVVGEKGPELFRPNSAGHVISNEDIGSMFGRGGGGTAIQIIDQRGTGDDIQIRELNTAQGRKIVQILVRDEIDESINAGTGMRKSARQQASGFSSGMQRQSMKGRA